MKLSAKGENEHDLALMDIAATLREGAEAYRVFFKHNNIALAVGVPQTLPFIRGNPDMLMQVISNILSNASRYTKSGGASLFATHENNNIVVKITDTGEGISPDMLPVIFERGVTKGGTGLGLSICKTVIEEIHDGKIFIASTVDEGTKVTILLPVAQKGAG
jgi:signal transduction histidine kinase